MTEEEQIEKIKTENIFKKLNSVEEMQDWLDVYFDIRFPAGVVCPESTHGPCDAIYEIYRLMLTGESVDCPEIVMLSSRDSGKSLAAAAAAVICLIHLRLSACILSAISSQSAKSVSYLSNFFRKITPYLKAHGWKQSTENTRHIAWLTDEGEEIYIKVVIATVAGANSEHTPMLFCDEIDVIANPKALEEAKMIPSSYKRYQPLTVYLSTRKFSGGLMEKTLKAVEKSGGKVLRWNIIDITQKIPNEEALISEPKVLRYITTQLPMSNLSPEEFETLTDKEKNRYEQFNAYAGIAEHPLLPVMKNMLVDRPEDDVGGLYKTVKQVRNLFRKIDTPTATAQLLCEKPSTSGLVYPRFEVSLNTLTPEQAIEKITGDRPISVSFEYLKDYLNTLGVSIIGGADWGFTDFTSLLAIAIMPNGEFWVLDCFLENELETSDVIKVCNDFQQKWNMSKWYVDQNRPDLVKSLKKGGLQVPDFVKDVKEGIASVQSAIIDSSSKRRLFIVKRPETQKFIDAFGVYRWKLDAKGDPTEVPYHDKDGTAISDQMDSLRYPISQIFGSNKKIMLSTAGQIDTSRKPLIVKELAPQETVLAATKQAMERIITNLASDDKGKPKTDAIIPKRQIVW